MSMKKISLIIAIASINFNFASYQVVYPNQTVNFKTDIVKEIFIPTDPSISDWSDVGTPYECSNYTPNSSDFSYGVVFTQTSKNCKIDQERTIQNRQISSATQVVSNVGEPVVEHQILNNQTHNLETTGTRHNYTMKVGNYNYGPTYYAGYFSDSYMSQFGTEFDTSISGTMSSSTFRGSTIDYLIEQGEFITMRVIPDISGAMPVITINGKSCTLNGPNVYTAYEGLCKFNLGNLMGQSIYIDLQ